MITSHFIWFPLVVAQGDGRDDTPTATALDMVRAALA